MKVFRVIVGLFFALFCVACTLIFLIQEDAFFKSKVQERISALFSQSFDCCCTARIERINFFTGTVTLRDVLVQEHEHAAWRWKADTIQLYVSLFSLIKDQKISTRMAVAHLEIYSSGLDELAIISHVKKLISPSGTLFPFEIKELRIKDGSCLLEQENVYGQLHFHGNVSLQRTAASAHYRFNVGMQNGTGNYQGMTIGEDLAGTIAGNICLYGKAESCLKLTSSCKIGSSHELCTIQGTWTPARFLLHYTTPSNTFSGNILVDRTQNLISLTAQAPISECAKIAQLNTSGIEGICSIHALTTCTDMKKNAHITLQCEKLFYKTFAFPDLNITLKSAANTFEGPVYLNTHEGEIIYGSCQVNPIQKNMKLTLENTKKLQLAQAWYIAPQALTLESILQPDGKLHVRYSGAITHEIHGEKKLAGTVQASRENIAIKGTAQECRYDVAIECKPFLHIKYAHWFLDEKPVIKLEADSPTSIAGNVSYPVIRFLTQSLGISIPGEGTLQITARSEEDYIKASITLENGNIRLPYTYNLLQDVRGNMLFDRHNYTLSMQDMQLKLHKGSIHISNAFLRFDEQGTISYGHIPLTINNCFLGMKKDLFALFSGTIISEYKNKALDISGYMFLDRAHIRNNIFSEQFLKNIVGTHWAPPSQEQTNINFSLNVMTRSSLRVKTPFLEAAAQAHMHLAGNLNNPEITGTIEIGSGSFLFPYKPLFIKRGKIYFLPQQMDNPVIDILAENNIRKFSVRMAIDGTAKQPNITFDATPNLEEEQIVSLLLGGSEDGSLVLAMPSSVMSSIEKLVFGPAESTSQFQRTLKNLFAPLKNLRITPSFSDKSARGGVRGSLVIDVNDRLRAIIEQNFSLPEDVVIQVEYDISDDARVRAIRDERGDLGGELEASWKF